MNPSVFIPFKKFLSQAMRQYSESARDLKTLLDIEPGNSAASKELVTVKQLWEKELRELQSKQPAPKASQKKTPTKSPSGKEKRAAASQKRTRSSQNGSKKSSRQQASSNRSSLHSQPATGSTNVKRATADSRLNDERTKPSGAKGEGLLTATKTTYYKEKEEGGKTTSKEGADTRDAGARRRRIIIEEREESSDDEVTLPSASANPVQSAARQPQVCTSTYCIIMCLELRSTMNISDNFTVFLKKMEDGS